MRAKGPLSCNSPENDADGSLHFFFSFFSCKETQITLEIRQHSYISMSCSQSNTEESSEGTE